MGHSKGSALLRICGKVPCTRVLQVSYRNVRAAKVTTCLHRLPAPEPRSLSTCAGTGTLTHSTHLPSRQKGACGSVTRYHGALDTLKIHLFQPAPNMCLLALLGELKDPSSVRKCRPWQPSPLCHYEAEGKDMDLWHPLLNSHSITCLV